MKVEFKTLNSANVTADNSVDNERRYEITANVNINGDKVDNISGGRVIKDEVEVASFSKWGESNTNFSFNVVDAVEMCSIITEVTSFCANVAEKVTNEPIEL
jgi:hypothetical protein